MDTSELSNQNDSKQKSMAQLKHEENYRAEALRVYKLIRYRSIRVIDKKSDEMLYDQSTLDMKDQNLLNDFNWVDFDQ